MRWTVPKMWAGMTVAVLASGPSMCSAAADAVRHLPRVAVNTTWRLAPDAEVIYAADSLWWACNHDALKAAGLKVSIEELPRVRPNVPAGVAVLGNSGVVGFDEDPTCMRTGGNSGYQAIHLAAHAGATRILLLGFDLQGGHWHGDHPSPLSNNGHRQYAKWMARFADLAAVLDQRGVDVLNCTPGSKLDAFRRVELNEALARAEVHA